MTTYYFTDRSGGFLAGDTSFGVASYAYPSSTYADRARRDPSGVAREMVTKEAKLKADYGVLFGRPLREAIDRWLADLVERGTPVG